MKDIYHQLIDNCEKTIKDLEENYMMFHLISGGLMKNSSSILLSQIESVKQEKMMYEKELSMLIEGNSKRTLLESYRNLH